MMELLYSYHWFNTVMVFHRNVCPGLAGDCQGNSNDHGRSECCFVSPLAIMQRIYLSYIKGTFLIVIKPVILY